MLIITLHVNAPSGAAIGVKEACAMDMEKYGDVRVVEVREVLPEQLRMEE